MKNEPNQPAALRPIRVLLVDDSPAFLEALREFLRPRSGIMVVATAEDGQAGLEQFARHRPDLVILDVVMPRMNGVEAAAHMRRLAPQVRIIMVSVHEDPETEAESLRHADSFLPKTGLQRRLWGEIRRLFPHLDKGAGV
jgi:DNA-binding NarL/FixJ family response regulator